MKEIRKLDVNPRYGVTRDGEVVNLETKQKLKYGVSKDGYARITLRSPDGKIKKTIFYS